PDPQRILFIGRLEREKNLFALVEALAGLTVELWIVGDGHERQALETLARERQVNVHFLGIRPHAELPALLNGASAFILPSLWEGHPKTLLEAMSCGLPCIGSTIPAIRGVLTHGVNGWLCDPNASSIHQAIKEIMTQPILREQLGQQARAYAVDHLGLEGVVRLELDLYRQLLPHRQP
ncbi:MAG: glycosyltransferase family 4 protein, partial [Magnetococcales bacterium]|nr:glycosyltransferase family 4 protein [Magnetococcales bacterium]